MKLSLFGRLAMALFASLALGLGMTACEGGTIGYMWVLGQQYNQIAGFKIDDYSGNLTNVQGSPFSSNGAMPVSLVIKPGGRFVYVINQGTGGSANGAGAGQNIAVYSVGGDGVLTFQQSYQSLGYISQWAQFDSTGTYLYVLDEYAPSCGGTGTSGNTCLFNGPNTDGNGAITVFSSDSTTGRLSLVTNAQTQINGVNTPFWEVGPNPFMMKTLAGCLFTANKGNQSISPYTIGSGGQLSFTTTQTFFTGTGNMTSINGSGSLLYLTDANSNTINGYTVGSSCALATVNGGNTANITGTSNPTYTYIDSTNKYLYVLNQSSTSTTTTTPYSSISAFTINTTNNELQPISGAPYPVGSGPVCMAEDPTNQYFYISNHNDGTITGKFFNPATGQFSTLSRGSTFNAVGELSCLAISGTIY
ncbi:beta-propeller fold lactonase family protein [Granulicella sp. 5B5]|uniref:beta-propeller fold lactonase family protein n=1 Tax=Granulicella sp. 5B5 TaxID=1617967 RepID=UPI0015F5D8B2|nr:beta-propeller fold lactonase family protein [Granulicella sp. 5B5]QMV19071.1 beta-propeller fold lactonase family protein [Granulicella sp. 5B5]